MYIQLLKAINNKQKNNNALCSSYLPPGKTTHGTDRTISRSRNVSRDRDKNTALSPNTKDLRKVVSL